MPVDFSDPELVLPGVIAVNGPRWLTAEHGPDTAVERFCGSLDPNHPINRYPLIVVVDDSSFASRSLINWLWVTFTRSNPAADVHGIGSFTAQKHWGCRGSLVIDARIKSHHAPPLVEDQDVSNKVDARAARGGPLAKYL